MNRQPISGAVPIAEVSAIEQLRKTLDVVGANLHAAGKSLSGTSPATVSTDVLYRVCLIDDEASVRESFVKSFKDSPVRGTVLAIDPSERSAPDKLELIVDEIVGFFFEDTGSARRPEWQRKPGRPVLFIDKDFKGPANDSIGFDLLRLLDKVGLNDEAALSVGDAQIKSALLSSMPYSARYVPRAMLTSSAFNDESANTYLTQGADDALFDKAGGTVFEEVTNAGNPARPRLTFIALFERGWPERAFSIQIRAFERYWRDLHTSLERWLADDLAKYSGLSTNTEQDTRDREQALWRYVHRSLTGSGFCSEAVCRTLVKSNGQVRLLALMPNPSMRPDEIGVADVRIYKELCVLDDDGTKRADPIVRRFSSVPEGQLLSDGMRKGALYETMKKFVGCHVIGISIRADDRILGAFCLIRQPGEPTFTKGDESHLKRLSRRLELHWSQVAAAQRANDRQLQLVHLATAIQKAASESDAIVATVNVLFAQLHPEATHSDAPATRQLVRAKTSVRLLDGATGILFREDNWLTSSMGGGQANEPLQLEDDANAQTASFDGAAQSGLYGATVFSGEGCFVPDVSRDVQYERTNVGTPLKASMVIPLSTGSGDRLSTIGAITCEHEEIAHYGTTKARSADWIFAEAVAGLLADGLRARRLGDLRAGLLRLARIAANDDVHAFMDEVAKVVFGATNCAMLGWCMPPDRTGRFDDAPWIVRRLWLADASGKHQYPARSSPTAIAESKLGDWNEKLSAQWQESGVRRVVLDARFRLRYSTYSVDDAKWAPDDDTLGFEIRSQASFPLVYRSSDVAKDRGTPQLMGVLYAGFRQSNGLSADQDKWLEELGDFVGQYLHSVSRNSSYFRSSAQLLSTEILDGARHGLKTALIHAIGQLDVEKPDLPAAIATLKRIDAVNR